MPAPRIRATLAPSATRVRSTARTCVRAQTATKVSIAPRISTNARPARLANTTDSASTLLDRFDATAPADSPDLDAKSTSMNAIPIPARTTALVWMKEELSAVSACQVCCLVS